MDTLGDRLRLARELKGLTQASVHKKTKINNKTLSRYENNGSEPDVETLKTLAELYGVTIGYLTREELTGEEFSFSNISDTDMKILTEFRKLNTEDQNYIISLIQRIQGIQKK